MALPLRLDGNSTTVILDRDLKISFRRTIRIPDNQETNDLPPDLGAMKVTNVKHVSSWLSESMRDKGGLLLPMHDGVNIISGEPETENSATNLRRRELVSQGRSIQDYIVLPGQMWLDSIAHRPGEFKQFVTPPFKKELTVEAQFASAEHHGCLRFEITPEVEGYNHFERPDGDLVRLFIHVLTGKLIVTFATSNWQLGAVAEAIRDQEDIPADLQRLIFGRRKLDPFRTLSDYNIQDGSKLYLLVQLPESRNRQRVSRTDAAAEMGLAAGGVIKQYIIKDNLKSDQWDRSKTFGINVQMLNARLYDTIISGPDPNVPISNDDDSSGSSVARFVEDMEPSDIIPILTNLKGFKSIGEMEAELGEVG
ncbi:hypothetical protein ABW20_dc0107363 [Dactylellina cionopaga]|nr:hypothetical protein ABW20_dc0107363 [Dactylellina cionopaga]